MDDIERIENALGEVRTEIKVMREAVTSLVRIDEKVANLIASSEKNSKAVGELTAAVWKQIDGLKEHVAEIEKVVAVNNALDGYNKNLLWGLVGGASSICITIIVTAFLGG